MKNVFLVCIFCIFVKANSYAQEDIELIEVVEICPEEVSLSELNTGSKMFYTIPDEELNLQLWYAEVDGTFQIPISLSVKDLLSVSPDGDYIVIIRTDTDYVSRNLFYAYYGAVINEIFLLDTDTYELTEIEIPNSVNEHRYVKHVQWISESTFSLVSTTEDIISLEVHIYENSIVLHEWNLPVIALIYPDGETRFSPDGEYIFYTTNDNLEERSWNIANRNGEILLEAPQYGQPYKSVSWLQNSSGVITTYQNGSILISYLNGDFNYHQYEQTGFLNEGGISSNDNRFVSYVGIGGYFDPNNLGYQRSLAIFDLNASNLITYCNPSLRFYLGNWSQNNFFAFIAIDTNFTQIYILDIESNSIIGILPELQTNSSINNLYIRVIGWS